MMQRDADLHAAILEGHDVLDVGQRSELAAAVRPHLDNQLDMVERKRPEAG